MDFLRPFKAPPSFCSREGDGYTQASVKLSVHVILHWKAKLYFSFLIFWQLFSNFL